MQNRRVFCRIAFILLGILPLMATLLYAGWRNHQYDADHFADLLGRSLGFTAIVQDVQYTSPGSMRLVGVELFGSEPISGSDGVGAPLVSCDEVSVQQADGGVVKVRIPQCVIHVGAGDQILYTIHERILKQPALLDKELDIKLVSLQMEQAPAVAFIGSTVQLRRIEHGAELRATLVPSEAISAGTVANSQPIDVTIRRDRSQAEQTTVLLKTWGYALPTSLIVGQRNWLPRLSSKATFRGNIECHLDKSGWSGDVLGGNLSNVDLDTFLGAGFGGWIRGHADFKIGSLKFESDRIRELEVDVVSQDGLILTDQLRNAIAEWQLVWEREPQPMAEQVGFRDLSLGIYLAAGEMQLRGRGEPKRTLLRLASGEGLQTSASYVPVAEPVASILSVLMGAATPSADTAEGEFLRRVLPLPSIRQELIEH